MAFRPAGKPSKARGVTPLSASTFGLAIVIAVSMLKRLFQRLRSHDPYVAVQVEHWTDPNLGGHVYRLQEPPPARR